MPEADQSLGGWFGRHDLSVYAIALRNQAGPPDQTGRSEPVKAAAPGGEH
jgi:hypothetical protein